MPVEDEDPWSCGGPLVAFDFSTAFQFYKLVFKHLCNASVSVLEKPNFCFSWSVIFGQPHELRPLIAACGIVTICLFQDFHSKALLAFNCYPVSPPPLLPSSPPPLPILTHRRRCVLPSIQSRHPPSAGKHAVLSGVCLTMASPSDSASFDQPPPAKKFGQRLRSLCALHPELTGHAMDYMELKGLLCVCDLQMLQPC